MSALSVTASGAAADAVAAHVPTLVADEVASRLFAQDHTLWGPAAEEESAKRLAWVGLARSSRPLVGEISALRDDLRERGVDRVILCGMGGSSLAPEVICATAGVPLVVLDSSHPDVVRAAARDLERTVVVVSSKSGSTVETDSQRRVLEQAFRDAGIDPAERVVVVTDPGSPLDEDARGKGYRVINADPSVGGRYSALTAFGLVPSGLAGADVEELLDDAESVTDLLSADDEANPALRLGAAMAGTDPLRDKLYLVDHGTPVVGFGDWAEQLIAESTGKEGKGILPVVLDAPGDRALPADATLVRLVGPDDETPDETAAPSVIDVGGTLGAQLLLWEAATAVAGRLLGINPFDQPDVESAKAAARSLLDAKGDAVLSPDVTDGAVEIRGLGGDWLGQAGTVAEALDALLGQLDDSGYVAVMAYLDREEHADLAEVATAIADRTGRPTTFGWGPRFLHSTGQYHKGGPADGVFVQVTDAPREDLAVPGRDFTLGEFIAAQAGGDAQVLVDHGRPVLALHLTEPSGVRSVLGAAQDGA
ncbi:glucose-6-phosphate isomerase [Janibacter sp. YIM B02568]|uniref:glucose-6-phosphate isomerase n=1 Tax=Janibacter endophyticus TaxID=2806261 RepID=UPI00194E75C5|nr:glucose-6-phosphate isomerase [Janibacter endophyticus]MBM6546457.1 glucose-6-phosphate isomerase [Janibacter endophyticus]